MFLKLWFPIKHNFSVDVNVFLLCRLPGLVGPEVVVRAEEADRELAYLMRLVLDIERYVGRVTHLSRPPPATHHHDHYSTDSARIPCLMFNLSKRRALHNWLRAISKFSALCLNSSVKLCFWTQRCNGVSSSHFTYNSSIRLEFLSFCPRPTLHTRSLLTYSCPVSPRLCLRRAGDVPLCSPCRRSYLLGRIPYRDILHGRQRDSSHSTTTCRLKGENISQQVK